MAVDLADYVECILIGGIDSGRICTVFQIICNGSCTVPFKKRPVELVRAGVLPADYDFEGRRELVGMQPGDVPVTYADSAALEADYGFRPEIDIRTGLRRFAEWYKEYYQD